MVMVHIMTVHFVHRIKIEGAIRFFSFNGIREEIIFFPPQFPFARTDAERAKDQPGGRAHKPIPAVVDEAHDQAAQYEQKQGDSEQTNAQGERVLAVNVCHFSDLHLVLLTPIIGVIDCQANRPLVFLFLNIALWNDDHHRQEEERRRQEDERRRQDEERRRQEDERRRQDDDRRRQEDDRQRELDRHSHFSRF